MDVSLHRYCSLEAKLPFKLSSSVSFAGDFFIARCLDVRDPLMVGQASFSHCKCFHVCSNVTATNSRETFKQQSLKKTEETQDGSDGAQGLLQTASWYEL